MTVYAISEVSICNQALARMGSTQTITSFSDQSNEAAQCGIWYPADRDNMLADYPWPWAHAYVQLAQVAGPEIDGQVANPEWSRSWRYPSDALKIHRVVSTPVQSATTPPQTTGTYALYPYDNDPWKRADGQPYPIAFGVGSDDDGRLLFTDEYGYGAGLSCVYTRKVSDPTQFSPDFADALAWRVAADLAMGLGFSDAKRQYAEQQYEKTIRKARATAMNETQGDLPYTRRTQSETVRARWGG